MMTINGRPIVTGVDCNRRPDVRPAECGRAECAYVAIGVTVKAATDAMDDHVGYVRACRHAAWLAGEFTRYDRRVSLRGQP